MGKVAAWSLLEICKTKDFEKNIIKEANKELWEQICTVKVALAQQIHIGFTQKAIELFGKIWGSLFLENMEVYYASLETMLCVMRINAKYKKEFFNAQHFVKIGEFFTLKCLHICNTMNQCKIFMTKHLLNQQVIEHFPTSVEELDTDTES